MKKIITGASMALIVLAAFSSCKKSHTCTCVTTNTKVTMVSMVDTTAPGGFVTMMDTTMTKTTSTEDYNTTKNDARDRCSSWSKTIEGDSSTTMLASDCSLK